MQQSIQSVRTALMLSSDAQDVMLMDEVCVVKQWGHMVKSVSESADLGSDVMLRSHS